MCMCVYVCVCFLQGFKAVECTNEIYEVGKDVLVQAKEKANIKVVLINMPKSKCIHEATRNNIAEIVGVTCCA